MSILYLINITINYIDTVARNNKATGDTPLYYNGVSPVALLFLASSTVSGGIYRRFVGLSLLPSCCRSVMFSMHSYGPQHADSYIMSPRAEVRMSALKTLRYK